MDSPSILTPRPSMKIDGICCSEAFDVTGEQLCIEGVDISSLTAGKGLVNWEHRGGDSEGASANDVIGKITFAKKIFSASDCSNERELKYWDSCKLPLVYIQCRLFDSAKHPGAVAAAAIIRDSYLSGEPIVLAFSVEGSTLVQEGQVLKESIARGCALTIKPAKHSAISGLLEDPNGPDTKKAPKDALEDVAKAEHQHPLYTRLGSHIAPFSPWIPDELAKALTAGSGGADAAPSSLTGGAALARQDFGPWKKKAVDFLKSWDGNGDFRKALAEQLPEADPEFIQGFADLADEFQLPKIKKSTDDRGTAPEPDDATEEENDAPVGVSGPSVRVAVKPPRPRKEGPVPAPTSDPVKGDSYAVKLQSKGQGG